MNNPTRPWFVQEEEPTGVWALIHPDVSAIDTTFSTELEANQKVQTNGYYSEVMFIPYGMDVIEARQYHERLRAEADAAEVSDSYSFNIKNQEHLADELKKIVEKVGWSQVADRVGVDSIQLITQVSTLNLTMTELRLLAHACEIEIGFSIS